jgi:hypothetical protein
MRFTVMTSTLGADIKIPIIRAFGLNMVGCLSFLESYGSFVSFPKSLTNSSGSLSEAIQKLVAAKRLLKYLTQVDESLEMMTEILSALSTNSYTLALTLMKKNNNKISFTISELIDDLFGSMSEDELTFPRVMVKTQPGSCIKNYTLELVEEPERTGWNYKQSIRHIPGLFNYLSEASSEKEVEAELKKMWTDHEANRKMDYESLLNRTPSLFQTSTNTFSTTKNINLKIIIIYMLAVGKSLHIAALSKTRLKTGVSPIIPNTIEYKNVLIGCRCIEQKNSTGRISENTRLPQIPLELLYKVVEECSLDTILRFNHEKVIQQLGLQDEADEKTAYKYLCYILKAVIFWFEQNDLDLDYRRISTLVYNSFEKYETGSMPIRLDQLFYLLGTLCNGLILNPGMTPLDVVTRIGVINLDPGSTKDNIFLVNELEPKIAAEIYTVKENILASGDLLRNIVTGSLIPLLNDPNVRKNLPFLPNGGESKGGRRTRKRKYKNPKKTRRKRKKRTQKTRRKK